MNLDQLTGFLRREWASFVAETVRPVRTADTRPDEGKLIERATEGGVARTFLESEPVARFMAEAEAKLTHEMLKLPLEDDAGRRNLAVAIQTQRQLWRYLAAAAQDGRAAEAELERLRKGQRVY